MAHLTWAITSGWLVVSGLGIHEALPAWASHLLGGHVMLVTWHGRVGDMLGLALLLAAFFVRNRLSRFLGAIMQFHRADAAWPLALLPSLPHPRQQPVLPWHDGRFDPAQRLVFLIVVGSFALLVMTGLVFNFIPTNIRLLFAWTVRIHLAAAWVFIAAASVHIIAGTGLLPTHRGVARAMFGDGRVRIGLARRLWPGWTARRLENKNSRKA